MNPNQKPRLDDQDYQDQVAYISSIEGNEQAMSTMEARYINQKFDDKEKEIYETYDKRRDIQKDMIQPMENNRRMFMERLGFTVENSPKEPLTQGQTAAIEQHYSDVHHNRGAAEISELEMRDIPFRAHFNDTHWEVRAAKEEAEERFDDPGYEGKEDWEINPDYISHLENLNEISAALYSIHCDDFSRSQFVGWPVEGLAHIPHRPTWKDLSDLPAWQSVLPKLNEVGIQPDFDAIKNEQLKIASADVKPTVKPQAGTLAEALAQIKSQPKPEKPENGIPPRPRRRM